MIAILVYNSQNGAMERYSRELHQPMPYITGSSLTVREFRGRSNSDLIWTDRRAMHAWNQTRAAWGRPIYVGYAFRRIGEGGHSNQSQHYAGTSFDVGQNLDNNTRNQLRNLASELGVWSYVEPAYLTPTWVHFDARLGPPACAAGYPLVSLGSKSVYVCTLQDALNTVGSYAVGIDGVFGQHTLAAVRDFQQTAGFTPDGIVGCATWTELTKQANGFFRRAPEVPPQYARE